MQYNTAIPHLIAQYFPEGMLGIAIVALIAAFMAGVAANVTAFNTVVTYDLLQDYVWKDRDPAFYLRWGRLMTVGGILISIATAFIAKGYSNMMNYIQTLFSIFNVPAVHDVHRRDVLEAGDCVGRVLEPGRRHGHRLRRQPPGRVPRDLPLRLGAERELLAVDLGLRRRHGGAGGGVTGDQAQASGGVARPRVGTHRKDEREVNADPRDRLWWRSPALLGGVAIAIVIALNIIFI